MEICMKNTNMIRFTRGAILAGLVLGSSMAHAWGAPIQVKVQPSWLSQYGKTLAVSATGLGLAAFIGASIYKYNAKATVTERKGFTGYFGFVWDGTKHYANATKDGVVNGAKKVRRYTWRTKAEQVEDLTKKNDALNKQLADEKDAPKNAELAKTLQPKIDANTKKIAALNEEIKADAKAKAEKDAADAAKKAQADKDAAEAAKKAAEAKKDEKKS
jgi:hypothetical protein